MYHRKEKAVKALEEKIASLEERLRKVEEEFEARQAESDEEIEEILATVNGLIHKIEQAFGLSARGGRTAVEPTPINGEKT